MTPEQIYDTEIAQRCQELGFPFVACCEWERAEGQRGHTEFCPATTDIETRPTSGQLLVHYAARSKGNIDALLMGVMKDSRKYGHSSIYLHQLGVPLGPSTPNVQAMRIGSLAWLDLRFMKLTKAQKARAFAALRRLLKGPHWEALNDRRSVLIDCEAANAITSDSLRELDALQALAGLRRMALAPYPAPRRSNKKDDTDAHSP